MEISEAVLGPLPFIEITSSLKIPTYSLLICLAACIALFWGFSRVRKSKFERDIFFEIYIIILLFGFIGARLFHVFYEAPDYYWQDPKQILYFWQGGFVYYGGLVLSLIVGSFYVKKIVPKRFPDVHPVNYSLLSWCDFMCPTVSLGYGLGRLACFLNGCCYGTICHLPWAVEFKTLNLSTGEALYFPRHPTQLYAVVWELILFTLILFLNQNQNRSQNKKPGTLFFIWLFLHAVGRLVMETFRADPRGALILDVSISTTISVFILLGAGILLVAIPKIKIDKKF